MKINDLLGSKQRKQLRRIAHHLRPVVTIADLEITDGVSNEVVRALTDHELIKIKIDISEKEKRQDVPVEQNEAYASIERGREVQHSGQGWHRRWPTSRGGGIQR